jgi:hypothetical protein
VALFGAVAVGSAMADIPVSQSVNSSQQALEQQINSEVNQGELSQAQQDLQSLEDTAGYTQPTTLNAVADLQIALAQAVQNSDWTLANVLLNEIQTLENGTNTSGSSTTTTPAEPAQPTYQDPTYQQPTQSTQTTNQDNSSTYQWRNQRTNRNNSSTHQWSIPKDIDQKNPILQQPWVQQLLQNNSQASNDSNWWLWQLLRKQHRN